MCWLVVILWTRFNSSSAKICKKKVQNITSSKFNPHTKRIKYAEERTIVDLALIQSLLRVGLDVGCLYYIVRYNVLDVA